MSKIVVSTTGAPAAIGPYSQAIVAGDTLYAFDSVEAIVREAGFAMTDIVKTTVYLADMGDFAVVNEIYGRRMPQPYPARSCVQVAALPKGALVEVEILARKC